MISVTTNGTVEPVTGPGHSNHVSGIAVSAKHIQSVGYDDTIRTFSSGKFSYVTSPIALLILTVF